MDITRAAHYIRQAAIGLSMLTRRRGCPRDIKPATFLVDRTGISKS